MNTKRAESTFSKLFGNLRQANNNVLIVFLCGVASTLLSTFILRVIDAPSVNDFVGRVALAECLFLIICMFFISTPSQFISLSDELHLEDTKIREHFRFQNDHDWSKAKKNATESLKQFKIAWQVTLAAWSALYLCLFVEKIVWQSNASGQAWVGVLENLANYASTAGLLACFMVLAYPTTRKNRNTFAWILLLVVFIFLELAISVNLLLKQDIPTARAVGALFGALMSIVAGTIHGLVAGRLDSKYFSAGIWFLVFLFGYAAIQPLYPLLSGNLELVKLLYQDTISEKIDPNMSSILQNISQITPLVLIFLAWFFKAILYVYINRWIANGRLLFYCLQTRHLYETVESDWNIFKKSLDKT